ncbi:MAG: hypothetical protein WBP12_03275 [Candidatus Saccharimonas sp.]
MPNMPERGSSEWIRNESSFIAHEAILIIDDAIATKSSWSDLSSIRGSIDPNYKQIDVEYVRGAIVHHTAESLGIPEDYCMVLIDYGRDYDYNRDYFNFEIIIVA